MPKIKKETTEKRPEKKEAKNAFQTLRGMKDILPAEQKYWNFIYDKVKKLALDYGFERIDTPILESVNLFTRSVGKQTDIVEKEMFDFKDRGGENICLRPEATASIARAYMQHGMVNLPQPVKLFNTGKMFRYDRPQSGRLRQFNQFGFEVIGDENPIIDARLILMAFNFYKEIGLDVSMQVNSIGCRTCREEYVKELVSYYKSRKNSACNDCKRRLLKNPLRLLDCKEPKCVEIRAEAPQLMDWLCEGCKNHFIKVLEYLDELEIPYNLNPYLVRGLDYYNRTAFEVWMAEDDDSSQNALGGGGRYDYLIESLGGRETPAVGFACGIERTILKIKENYYEGQIPKKRAPDVFLAQLGEQAKRKCLVLFEDLLKAGIRVVENLSKDGLRPQLEMSNKLGVKYTLILGQKEVVDDTILIRDMEGGIQEVVDFKKVIPELKKKMGIE